jgi:hypothetical protein
MHINKNWNNDINLRGRETCDNAPTEDVTNTKITRTCYWLCVTFACGICFGTKFCLFSPSCSTQGPSPTASLLSQAYEEHPANCSPS